MTDESFGFETIGELAKAFSSGRLSPVDYATRLLDRIEALNPALAAFTCLTRPRALAEAEAAEAAIARGEAGPLAGVPYAAKDIFDVAGEATMAGSRLLADNVAAADCTVVRKLTEAGMVLLGKTHTAQFASTVVGINHDQGTPHNPWARRPHVPGGSSSGSAVAVAAGLVPLALASDTGGSVRAPASLCGTVGLKTTVGRISRAGVFPLSATYDSLGPLTRSVADAGLVALVLAGPDPGDPATADAPSFDGLDKLKDGIAGLHLICPQGEVIGDLDPEVAAAVDAAAGVLRGLGATVSETPVPELDELMAMPDRFAVLNGEAYDADRRFLEDHAADIDPVVLWIAKGKDIDESQRQAVREKLAALQRRFLGRLQDVDALLLPTTPIPARPVDEVDADHGSFAGRYARFTHLGNLLGLTAVSRPCGFTGSGLPIGLMITAKPFREDLALRIAQAYERATDWHRRHPDLSWIG